MRIRLQRFLSVLTGFLLSVSAAVLVLAILLEGCGTSAALMSFMMQHDAPPADTGLPAEEYDGMAEMITGYLSGTVSDFQYTLTAEDGTLTTVFRDHEQLHMADCLALFNLDRKVLLLSGLCAFALMLVILLRRDHRRTAAGCLAGTGTVLLAVIALCVWAAVDFTGPFLLFHRISFSNDLWMLDPATSMLIRLMPLSFFIHYVILIAVTWLAFLLLMGGASLRRVLHSARRKPRPGAHTEETPHDL